MGSGAGAQPASEKAYEKVVRHIVDGVNFVDVVAGAAYAPVRDSVEFFTSHEALLLEYEEALTREVAPGRHYDLSAHLVWIGDRTRDPESGHVEFCRGISNPVAFKVDGCLVLCFFFFFSFFVARWAPRRRPRAW